MYFIRIILVALLLFVAVSPIVSQSTSFGDEPVKWANVKAPELPQQLKDHENSDLVVINDKTEFYFYASNNEKVVRHILVKINTQKGLDKFQTLTLPESFDEAYDCNLYKQGRRSRLKIPFIAEYHVRKFGARVFSSTHWQPVTFKVKFEQPRRIKYTGEFIKDELAMFQMQNLSVGDVVELSYEADFNSMYGSNLFYFQSAYPKINCEYDFIYKVNKNFADYSFILPLNIKDSAVKRSYTEYNDFVIFTDKIKLTNVKGVNYPANSKEAINGPHVFADFKFYRVVNGSYPTGSGRLYEYDLFRPKKFEWIIYTDTVNNYTKIYDKQFASIRKFVATLPAVTSDSSNITFFKAMCDTFNNFRYISANHLFYNESALYNLYSGDHLLKRRLVEHTMWKLYRDILNDKKVFYYLANVEDRRYSEHNLNFRTHYAYENNLVAIPVKNSFIYFMPRYDGIKYHLNELPFYFEGSLTALFARNFQEDTKNKDAMVFRLMKTHQGTFNENARTENVTVKIALDSLSTRLTVKESLSGQFSTLLRHLYLNEFIDSTVSPHYFKKCLDKPNASAQKIKLSSSINEFPFRYTFNCSEKITLADAKTLNLKNWFSFILSKKMIPEMPTHDYYLDFDFSDAYNFSLEFNKPAEILNVKDFERTIDNALFKLESKIIKNSDTNYLLKVEVVAKRSVVPLKQMALLQELLDELDKLDNFSLILESR
ncbi:MAG: hypothetical protein JNJ40_04990 [Bacteroidia bacterium]|nr:hypothetical protein [Bacteroidia bacterium]